MTLKVTVITVSDRAKWGIYEDLSGKIIADILQNYFEAIEISRLLVADERDELLAAFSESETSDFIITTGGTGISPRDITPEVTKEFCEKELPGISEILRRESYKETPFAMLSRGHSGLKGKCIVINFPGSTKAVTLCTNLILPVMEHSVKMLQGKGH